jgi:hypothetical protein
MDRSLRHRCRRTDRRTRCVDLSRPGPTVRKLVGSVFDFAVISAASSSATFISRTCASNTNRVIISRVRGNSVISSFSPKRIQMARLAKGSCGLTCRAQDTPLVNPGSKMRLGTTHHQRQRSVGPKVPPPPAESDRKKSKAPFGGLAWQRRCPADATTGSP